MSLDNVFPNLALSGYRVTSPSALEYNCIAWAAEEHDRWWWPDAMGGGYWPAGVHREETLPAFISAYEQLGYSVCENASFESGFLKVAIYAKGSDPTHAARQLSSGRWTSKLGPDVDLEHALDGLAGDVYGTVAVVMKRPIAANP